MKFQVIHIKDGNIQSKCYTTNEASARKAARHFVRQPNSEAVVTFGERLVGSLVQAEIAGVKLPQWRTA